MAWTTPRTWTTGETVTASLLNTHVRDNLTYLSAVKSFRAYQSAGQAIASSTDTKVSFQTEVWDTEGQFDPTTNYRHTPLIAGKWLYTAIVHLPNSNGGRTFLSLRKTGAIHHYGPQYVFANDARPDVTGIMDMNGSTDYAEVYLYHEAGASRTITTGDIYSAFSGAWLGA